MANTIQLRVDEIIKQASQGTGGGPYTGDELRAARIDLEMVLQDLSNVVAPLSVVEEVTILVSTQKMNLDKKIKDILSIVDTSDGVSSQLNFVDLQSFNYYNLENTTGRPTLFTTHKKADVTEIKFYPVPDTTYTMRAIVEKDFDEIEFYDQVLNVRSTYLPAVIKGLRYYFSVRNETLSLDAKISAKNEWEEARAEAIDADSENAPLYIRFGGQRRR